MSNLSAFKANMVGGGARPNQYSVYITFPQQVQASTGLQQNINFLCRATSLPGGTIGEAPVFYRGRAIYLAGDREFEPWTITVYNDNNFSIRNTFEKWMNIMNNNQTNMGALYPLTYQSDMYVNQEDRNGGILKTYKFVEAFPIAISEIELNYEENNRVEEFQVTFRYQYWLGVESQGALSSITTAATNIANNAVQGTIAGLAGNVNF